MSQKNRIVVISLGSAIYRREGMRRLFHGSGAAWEFIDAIKGSDLDNLGDYYNEPRRMKLLGYPMRPNEVACFLSHRLAWEECVKKNQTTLVLEDDARATEENIKNIDKIINDISVALGDEYLFVRLGSLLHRKYAKVCNIKHVGDVIKCKKDPLTTMAYILSPCIAEKLLVGSQSFFMPVDEYMWRGWMHGCNLLDFHPNLFSASDEDTPSTIGNRTKLQISTFKKIRREYFRLKDRLNSMLYVERSIKEMHKVLNHEV